MSKDISENMNYGKVLFGGKYNLGNIHAPSPEDSNRPT